MSERAKPFYCPYCGDEDLRPEENGGWLCSACRRVFSVTFVGLSLPAAVLPAADVPAADVKPNEVSK